MKLENQNILIISNEAWGDIWYSKHNYAYELSKKNSVYFIDPAPRWKFENLFNPSVTIKSVGNNLYIISYLNFLPALNILFLLINNFIISRRLRLFLLRKEIKKPLIWTFDPYRLFNPKLLNPVLSIFHCVDKFAFKHKAEKILCKSVDVFILVSEDFIEDYKPFKKTIIVIPHGISSEEFNVSEVEKNFFDIPVKDYALYIGNIDDRLDYELIEKALIKFPGTNFVFIGNIFYSKTNITANKIFRSKTYKNLIFIGPKPFKQLKAYIEKAKLCLALMNKDHPGNTISHHKIYQYFALGKPVLGIEFSEYKAIPDLIYMNNDHDKILNQFEVFLNQNEDIALFTKRIEYARERTYEKLFCKIENKLTEYKKQ
ncbi:MAG: hypothetical protein M3Q58_16710 [Bacteroidota bacterium]|nr:hypothetical protein [Bacteroidota bacterium]